MRESGDKLWPLLPLLTCYQACQCLHTSCVLPMLFFYISVMSIRLPDVQGSIPMVKGRSYILFLFYSISDPALQELLKPLSTIALQDRAPSTVKTYLRAFCRCSRWANCINSPLYQIEALISLPTLPSCCKQHGRHLISTAVPDRFFKRHGGWKSEATKDSYLKECFLTYNSPDLLDCNPIIQLHSMLWPSTRVLWRLAIQTFHFVRREMIVLAGRGSDRSEKQVLAGTRY